jgi:hypothetical protein
MVVERENSRFARERSPRSADRTRFRSPAPNSLGRDRIRAGPHEAVEVQVVWLSPEPHDSFEEFERFLRRMIAGTAFRARRARK